MRLKAYKQRKLNDHVYSFLSFASSGPPYQAEISKVAYSQLNLVPRVSPPTLQGTGGIETLGTKLFSAIS